MTDEQSTDLFGKYISIIHRYARAFFDRKLADASISGSHMSFLFPLYKNDGLSQDELSDMVCMDKTTIARAIKSLVDLGYVVREHDTEDKRIYRLYLTPKSKAFIPRVKKLISEWNSAISQGLSPDEKMRLQEYLKYLSENARQFKGSDFKEPPGKRQGNQG